MIFFSLIMIAVILLLEYSRRPVFKIDALRLTVFWIIFLYFFIPNLFRFSSEFVGNSSGPPLMPKLIVIVGVLFLYVGYNISRMLPVIRVDRYWFSSHQSFFKLSVYIVFLSFVALNVYANSFGGFIDALSYGALNRYTGQTHREVEGGAVALYFVTMSGITIAIAHWALLKKPRIAGRWWGILLFSFLIILTFGFIHASRGVLVGILLLAIYVYINTKSVSFLSLRKSTLWLYISMFLLVLFGLYFVLHGKTLIGNVSAFIRDASQVVEFKNDSQVGALSNRFIKEYQHPFKSLEAVINADIDYNLGKHFIVAPLHLIPTKLIGLDGEKPFRITEINTYLLTDDSEGGIPPGLVASFWYAGGLYGVIIGMLMAGIFIGFIQRQSYAVLKRNIEITPVVFVIFFRVAGFVNNGDLSVFLKHSFSIFVFLIFIMLFIFMQKIKLRF